MILTFKTEDLLATTLIEEESQEAYFATIPSAKFWSTQSVPDEVAIYAIFEELKGKYTAAALKFKRSQITDMTFLREEMELNIFMDSFISPNQCVHPFLGSEKSRYSWVVDAERMVCYEEKTKRMAAGTRWTKWRDQRVHLQLEISEDDLGSMDALVVTCIVCEFARRQNRKKYRKGSFLDL